MASIGWAIDRLHDGQRVARKGWDAGMWIALQEPVEQSTEGSASMTLPYVYMMTAQGQLIPWVCSQMDLLTEDWQDAYD